MNSGFYPAVVEPLRFKIQRQSQQKPFYFGGSQVPNHISGSGAMKINRPQVRPALRDYSGMEGEGVLDDIRNAFKPKNIAKAFDPVKKFADKTGITKFVTKTLPKTLIEKGVPMAAEFVGSKFGVGKQARALGEMGAKELKKVSGLGLKKGSPEMKAHMAKLRAMRKKK